MGNEFSSVEALWSTFENVMGKEDEGTEGIGGDGNESNADEAKSEEGQEDLEQDGNVKMEA